MDHAWERVPGQSTVWVCRRCGARGRFRISPPPGGDCRIAPAAAEKATPDASAEAKQRFLERAATLGRVGVAFRLRKAHPLCWDWAAEEDGLHVLDDAYRTLAVIPWEKALGLL